MRLTTEKIVRIVAANVRAARKRAGLSQTKLAKKAGVSDRYIQTIETKPKNLSLKSMLRIANALDVPLTELVVTPGAADSSPISPDEVASVRTVIRLLESFIATAPKTP